LLVYIFDPRPDSGGGILEMFGGGWEMAANEGNSWAPKYGNGVEPNLGGQGSSEQPITTLAALQDAAWRLNTNHANG